MTLPYGVEGQFRSVNSFANTILSSDKSRPAFAGRQATNSRLPTTSY
jgi:hypothetical protein